jgi:dynein heavy chain
MNSLLKMMNGLYLPTFLNNGTWPEGVKKEFSGSLHKFMASLTQTANEVKNHTVLYLPESEDLTNIERAAKDKDLVQRLETLLIHWTRQIKEVSNQETSHHVDTSGPLEEIEFWRSRTIDLSGIRSQIDRPGM